MERSEPTIAKEVILLRCFCIMALVPALMSGSVLAQGTVGLTSVERVLSQPVMMAGALVASARECKAQGYGFTAGDLARIVTHSNNAITIAALSADLTNRAIALVEEMARAELAAGHLDQAGCLKVREGVRLLAPDMALDNPPN